MSIAQIEKWLVLSLVMLCLVAGCSHQRTVESKPAAAELQTRQITPETTSAEVDQPAKSRRALAAGKEMRSSLKTAPPPSSEPGGETGLTPFLVKVFKPILLAISLLALLICGLFLGGRWLWLMLKRRNLRQKTQPKIRTN